MEYKLDNNILSIKIESIFEETIQEFFDNYIPSKKIQHLLIQNKWIDLDSNPVKRESDIVGEYLRINIYPIINNYKKIDNKIDVIYEDEFILIVNKPKDLIVHSDNENEITLNKMVESYYSDKNYISCLPIHRLDKETSGLVLYSKSIIFQPLLDKMLQDKEIRRTYLAFIEGNFKEESINVDKAIGKDRHINNKYVVSENGLSAFTKFRKIGFNNKDNYSVVKCSLESGRTHQIRVHLKSLGYTILNDEIYGHKSNLCIRMGLFAQSISFFHPIIQENIEVEANLPNDLSKLYESIN